MDTAPRSDTETREAPTIRVMAVGSELDEAERIEPGAAGAPTPLEFPQEDVVFDLQTLSCFYGSFRAVKEISLKVPRNQITAIIVLLVVLLGVNALAIFLRNRFERRW